MEYIQGKVPTKEAALVSGGMGSVLENTGSPELGLVVDQSGSMERLGHQLMESFNALLAEQKGAVANAQVSLALFNNSVQMVHDGSPVADVPLVSSEIYQPDGGTALNDASASMIQAIGKRAKRGTRVMIAILTDGDENSSRRFSTGDILRMITHRRVNYDWQFIFIGPPHSVDYGLKIGIQRSNIVEFSADPEGLKLLMHRLSKSVRAYQLGDRKYALKLRN